MKGNLSTNKIYNAEINGTNINDTLYLGKIYLGDPNHQHVIIYENREDKTGFNCYKFGEYHFKEEKLIVNDGLKIEKDFTHSEKSFLISKLNEVLGKWL